MAARRAAVLSIAMCCVVLLAVPRPAVAWGAKAHGLVASLAEMQLSGEARVEADRLLALEPGATLASISSAVDDERTPLDAAWHYVNLPRDAACRYDAARDCPGGDCVVAALDRQRAILRSTASDGERLQALKYVVHLVADVHQPLHAGFADDRGGNRFQVQSLGRGTNLHAVWDVDLVDSWPGGTTALLAALKAASRARSEPIDPARWAAESCRIVSSPGFYPGRREISDEYRVTWAPALRERLSSAARRLAAVLNDALASRSRAPTPERARLRPNPR
jgi:hypothetical protein